MSLSSSKLTLEKVVSILHIYSRIYDVFTYFESAMVQIVIGGSLNQERKNCTVE